MIEKERICFSWAFLRREVSRKELKISGKREMMWRCMGGETRGKRREILEKRFEEKGVKITKS